MSIEQPIPEVPAAAGEPDGGIVPNKVQEEAQVQERPPSVVNEEGMSRPEMSYCESEVVVGRTRVLRDASEYLGTVNMEGLRHPAFAAKPGVRAYDDLGALTIELDQLSRHILFLKAQLKSELTREKPTPFAQFASWLLLMEERLAKRSMESSAFCALCDAHRREAAPSFLGVRSRRFRPRGFDPLAASLLASNEERGLFTNEDLQQQNQELRALVSQQEASLGLLSRRLALFEKFQRQASAKFAGDSLRSGAAPAALAGSAPTRALELRSKRKALSEELRALVAERKAAFAAKFTKRVARRRDRWRSEKAVKIQSVARGFLVRRQMKVLRRAAVTVQRIWRGYRVRSQMNRANELYDRLMGEIGASEGKSAPVTGEAAAPIDPAPSPVAVDASAPTDPTPASPVAVEASAPADPAPPSPAAIDPAPPSPVPVDASAPTDPVLSPVDSEPSVTINVPLAEEEAAAPSVGGEDAPEAEREEAGDEEKGNDVVDDADA